MGRRGAADGQRDRPPALRRLRDDLLLAERLTAWVRTVVDQAWAGLATSVTVVPSPRAAADALPTADAMGVSP